MKKTPNSQLKRPEDRNQPDAQGHDDEVERQTYLDEVGEAVVAYALHNEVGLITNGRAETGTRCHADAHNEGHRTYAQMLGNGERDGKR